MTELPNELVAAVGRELHFMCCICGGEIQRDDPEMCQIVVIHPWGGKDEESEATEQFWWAHRKPCYEGILQPPARDFYDD